MEVSEEVAADEHLAVDIDVVADDEMKASQVAVDEMEASEEVAADETDGIDEVCI